jgi:hypothetical protein
MYYNTRDTRKSVEKNYERVLQSLNPKLSFSVKNQARMHRVTGDPPYTSSRDALLHVPDTTSAVGVSAGRNGKLRILAPFGLEDFWNMTVRPTPYGAKHYERYEERIRKKGWQRRWPRVRIYRS